MIGEQHRRDISDRAQEEIGSYTIGERRHKEVLPEIPGSLSMVYFGYLAPMCQNGICRRTMVVGKIRIAGFAGGGIRAFGKICWEFC